MPFIFKRGDWGIYRTENLNAHCLRHLECKGTMEGAIMPKEGTCACVRSKCQTCKTKVPDEFVGFMRLVTWEK